MGLIFRSLLSLKFELDHKKHEKENGLGNWPVFFIMKPVNNQLYTEVCWHRVYDKLRAQARDQVYDQVRGQVYDKLRAQVRGQVSIQVYDKIRDQITQL